MQWGFIYEVLIKSVVILTMGKLWKTCILLKIKSMADIRKKMFLNCHSHRHGNTGIFFKMRFSFLGFRENQQSTVRMLRWLPHHGVHHISNLAGTAPVGWQQLQQELTIWLLHRLNSYLHVLASGSNTSMVFKYVVPSKPPTAISCPFTTARPTCKNHHR